MNIQVAIVDDDESVCRSFGRLLRAVGMEPSEYQTAEAFLADAAHARFDCLVLDVQLGGMSGVELQRRLVQEGFRVPILFITAYDEPGLQAEAESLGCAGFFHKTEPGSRIIEAITAAARAGHG